MQSNFKTHLDDILTQVKHGTHFAFSKYADGEYKVLRNERITNCDNWTFDPDIHQYEQKLLLESFQYSANNYVVGISCPCCQPRSHVQWMRNNVKTKKVTWANLFVNSNYSTFKDKGFKLFDNWKGKVILVANESGINSKLPFKVDEYVPIKIGSWFNPELDIILEKCINMCKEDNQLFLFSGGPLGNMLCYKLHAINNNNTYIDIGSTINPWILGKNNRGYLKENGNNNKVCIW